MKILFTVCGRAGSKGFKNKNLKEMNGIPLIYYTLAVIKAYQNRHPEDIITVALNTDSEPLRKMVEKQNILKGVKYIPRKEELAGDVVPKVDVIKDTYLECKADGSYFDIVVDLDLTSPMRRVVDVENAIKEFCKNKDYDLVFSVVHARRNPYFNMVKNTEEGYFQKVCPSNYTARQQAPDIYELNASIYVYNPEFFKSEITKTLLDYKCGISIMEDYLVLDIDSEEDFQLMQMLHKFYCESDEGLQEVRELAWMH